MYAVRPLLFFPVLMLSFAQGVGAYAQSTGRVPLTAPHGISCPVQIDSLTVGHDKLSFVYRNSTDSNIQGIMFGAAYFDSVQDPHLVRVDGGFNKLLKPGRYTKSGLDIRYWHNAGYSGWLVWPQKILYTNGKIWEEGQGRASCGIEHWVTKYIRSPVPPDEILLQKVDPAGSSGK